MPAVARLTSPAGAVSYVCYEAPGHTSDPAAATRFATDRVAWRAANAAIYGDPNAFWPSERRAAANTRQRMRGWRCDVIEAP